MSSPLDPHWRYAYLDSVTRADRRGALRLVQELRSQGVAPDRIMLDLVCYAQERAGLNWECNRWNVAQEHAATAVSEAVVAYLAAEGDVPTDRGCVVVTCVEDEWHSMPARIVSEVVRLAGWDSTFLGAATPVTHLATFVQEQRPRAVAISCSVPTALPRVRAMIEAVRGESIPTIVGGRGVPTRAIANAIGADGYGATAAAAVYELEHLPEQVSTAPPMAVPDDDYAVLSSRVADVADAAMAEVDRQSPAAARMTPEQRRHTAADLRHVVEFTVAALFVDDERILTDFAEWMHGVLTTRGLPSPVVDLAFASVEPTLDELSLRRAARFVGTARDRLRTLPATAS